MNIKRYKIKNWAITRVGNSIVLNHLCPDMVGRIMGASVTKYGKCLRCREEPPKNIKLFARMLEIGA